MTISSTTDFNKISPTALLTAYARQFSDIPYTKEIAELTDAVAVVDQFINVGQEQPIVLAALIEARYKTIEQVMDRFNGTQILELASGLLPRGMIRSALPFPSGRAAPNGNAKGEGSSAEPNAWASLFSCSKGCTLSQQPEITFIESDLPDMIGRKQQLVQQLIGERPNLHFLAIDATYRPNPLPLKDYFHPEQPLTILCEGLLMYLTFAEKQQVFANVREMLQIYGGVWITSDFNIEASAKPLQADSAWRQINQKIISSTGRAFSENRFDDLEHVKQFALEQGFQVEAFSMLEVIGRLNCISVLGINRERVKALLATRHVVALTLV